MEMTQNVTAVLLPAAAVDFFVQDDGTAKIAETVAADWRFARVKVGIQRGALEAAIAYYHDRPSPEIIVIETDDISDAFIAKLSDLASVCAAGTDAVIIGPKNDVRLYRSLIDMGVRDYLVRPVVQDDLVKIIAKDLVEKKGLNSSRLVTVIGAKGGVGTTTVAQMLGTLMADDIGLKTILTEVSGSIGTLGVSFGLESTGALAEGVRLAQSGTDDDLKRLLQPAGQNLSVLAWGGDAMMTDSPSADGIEALVHRLMQKTPVVVVDLSGAMPSVQKRLISLSAHVVVVTTGLLLALRDARSLLNEIRTIRSGLDNVSVVINQKGIAGNDETSLADIEKALSQAPSATIPFAAKTFAQAELSGMPVTRQKSRPDFVEGLMTIAAAAAAAQVKPKSAQDGAVSGMLSIFKNIGKK